MTVVLVGMLICVGLAVAVLAVVAVPRVRGGDKLLTADGETAVRDAQRRARSLAAQARAVAEEVKEKAVEQVGRQGEGETRPDERAAEEREPEAPAASAEPDAAWQPAEGLRPAAAAAVTTAGAAATTAARPGAPVRSAAPARSTAAGQGDSRVIDLRDTGPVSRERARMARRLEWGEPEPGPRHRR